MALACLGPGVRMLGGGDKAASNLALAAGGVLGAKLDFM